MSVIEVLEDFKRRPGRISLDSADVDRRFKVTTDDADDDSLTVLADSNLPSVKDDHPSNTDYWCVEVGADPRSDDQFNWFVTAKYELKPPMTSGTTENEPWDEEPLVFFGFVAKQEIVERAYALNETIAAKGATRGDPAEAIVNSNERPFDPPVMADRYYRQIIVRRNYEASVFDVNSILSYADTLNTNDPITIGGYEIGEFEGWLKDIKADPSYNNDNVKYYQVTFEILINDKTWIHKEVDKGIFTSTAPSVSGPRPLTPIVDTNGEAIREPVLLDGNGQRLDNGAAPVVRAFHIIWEADWSSLDFPSTPD
jgi:hypothetical protein